MLRTRRTRFMNVLFLALSVAFLFVADFRWGLQMPVLDWALASERPERAAWLLPSPSAVRSLANEAETQRNAEGLAFAALHWPQAESAEKFRLAEQAVSLDPGLAWIYFHVASQYQPWPANPAVRERIPKWTEALEAADPGNALAALTRAELARAEAGDWPTGPAIEQKRDGLWERALWRQQMERAFGAPRYNTYGVARFDLERRVLREKGWATPATVVSSILGYGLPDLRGVREFADLQVNRSAAQAERDGRRQEALKLYAQASAFGRILRQDGTTLIEHMVGNEIELLASKPLAGLLDRDGRGDEAALLRGRVQELGARGGGLQTREFYARSAVPAWTAFTLLFSSFVVVLLAVLALVTLAYTNAVNWIRRGEHGRLYNITTIAENYVAVGLFVACAAVYLLYAPYANNFRSFMSTSSPDAQYLETLLYNIYPGTVVARGALPFSTPFRNYVPWALAAFVVAALIAAWGELRWRRAARAEQPKAAAANAG